MDTINLTSQDLTDNKDGNLSPRQIDDLRRQRLAWIGGTAAIAIIIFGLAAVILLKIINPDFANQGQLIIVLSQTD